MLNLGLLASQVSVIPKVWTTANTMPASKITFMATGSMSAAIVVGGNGGEGTHSDEYNSGTWSSGPACTFTRRGSAAGLRAASLFFSETTATQSYNDVSFSTEASCSVAKNFSGASGSFSNVIVTGGETRADVESFNGTSFTTEASITTATSRMATSGNDGGALIMCGKTTTEVAVCQSFDTSSWTTETSLNENRAEGAGGGDTTGESTTFYGWDGSTNTDTTEEGDGTSWSYQAAGNVARRLCNSAGNASGYLAMGGFSTSWGGITEEYA